MAYKEYTSSINAHVSSSAHTNEEFKWYVGSSTPSNVYFGMKDDDGNFSGKLSLSSYTLTSDTSGCSATVKNIDSTNTAGIIYLTIPANTSTTTNRTIVFKYGTVSLFTVVLSKYTGSSGANVVFQILQIVDAQTIVISLGTSNFASDGTTISCNVNDWTPNSNGLMNAQFSIDIPSGYGYSNITVPSSKGSFYKNHEYSLVGPCVPASYKGYNFSVSSNKYTYRVS